MSDNEAVGWVRRESIQGGWLVYCRLCGKRTRRTFVASMTDYAEAEKASRTYRNEHAESGEHRAALEVYHADEAPELSEHDRLLAKAFGDNAPTEDERRRRAARDAATLARRRPAP